MGRPTALTPAVQKRIVSALRDGCTRKAAASLGGVSYQTFLTWLERGRNGEAEFLEFLDAVEAAEDEAEAKMTLSIRKAAVGYTKKRVKKYTVEGVLLEETVTTSEFDWRAALEWLKRRRRPDWGDVPAAPEVESTDKSLPDVQTLTRFAEYLKRIQDEQAEKEPAADEGDYVQLPDDVAGEDGQPT